MGEPLLGKISCSVTILVCKERKERWEIGVLFYRISFGDEVRRHSTQRLRIKCFREMQL